MSEVTFIKIFEADPYGHGGQKRAYQLEKLITASQSSLFLDFQPKRRFNKRKDFYVALKVLVKSLLLFSFKNYFWKVLLTVKMQSAEAFIMSKRKKLKDNTIIWEANFPEFYTLPKKIKCLSINKLIACPHNLESLIDQEYVNWGKFRKSERLEMELQGLKDCDYIFTISEEEQWLLNNFGIKANYLPYYPEGICFEQLLKVREQRLLNANFDTLLILGSATNTPTYKGMKSLIEYIYQSELPAKFVIAGFGTEVFSEFESKYIQCLGTLKEEELHNLMVKTKAIIISQGFSTGALTKIPEFLVAGIPVITDEGSSRSFKRFNGVYQIRSFSDLYDTINSLSDYIPLLPERPLKEYQFFLNCLTSK